jgi:hypothetical protein
MHGRMKWSLADPPLMPPDDLLNELNILTLFAIAKQGRTNSVLCDSNEMEETENDRESRRSNDGKRGVLKSARS